MNEEKQIEEMELTEVDILANDINQHCADLAENYCGDTHCVSCLANALYNAGYRKQSENVIELPCKVGDTIYLPWQYDGVKAVAFLTVKHIIISEHRSCIRTDFFTDDEGFWEQFNGGEFNFSDFGNKVFVSKDEAEKALAKMKGGGK